MQNQKWHLRAARLLLSAFCLLFSLSAFAGEVTHPASAPNRLVEEGRELFQKREYMRALASFERALTYSQDRDTQYLAGLAAYWSREYQKALDYFTQLLDKAPRDSEEEWKLESARVMALSALGEKAAAELVVQRLRELRPKLAQSAGSPGFVREHFFLNASEGEKTQRFRVGVWEVIDLRGEAPDLWTFPIVAIEVKEDRLVRTLRVEVSTLPTGGRGYAFTEGEGPSRLVYKYWVQRPEYDDVRAFARQVLVGEAQPLKDSGQTKAATKPAAPEPTVRVYTEKELAAAAHISRWGLPPTSSLILTLAARLKDVEFDVTHLTRAALNDPADAERLLQALRGKHPFATEDAAELVDIVSRAKVMDVNTAAEHLPKLGARKPYLEYALLTAYNTRGADVPVFLLQETLKSPDALVRQTSALLLARYGDRVALELLFNDLATSDALGCKMIHGWLEELLGQVLPVPPPATRDNNEAPLNEWKQKVATWWKDNSLLLKHTRTPKPSSAYWAK